MKKLFFVLLIMMVACVARADDYEPWGEPTCENDSEYANFANECNPDTDTNTENGNEIGVGADVILWQAEDDSQLFYEVTAEYRYDTHSGNQEVYGVAKINLWSKIKKFFKKG